MLGITKKKAKTAAGARALKRKEPVEEEGAKTAIFCKATTSSKVVTDLQKDLYALKKPDAKMFGKKNDIHPFEDYKTFEFLSQKNDNSLFCLASHSKKRPHNLVFARMFNYELLDMIELGVQSSMTMSEFKVPKVALGNRPLILFRGEHWESSDELRTIKSIFLDMYTGDTSTKMIDLNNGLSHVMVFTLVGTPAAPCRILLRVYNIELLKSEEDTKRPKVELVEMGPRVEFIQRRCTLGNPELIKESLRVPKMNAPKKQKNIEKNEFGEKTGRIWMEKQDISQLQTRKMKGLKRKAADEGSDEQDNDEQDDGEDESGEEL